MADAHEVPRGEEKVAPEGPNGQEEMAKAPERGENGAGAHSSDTTEEGTPRIGNEGEVTSSNEHGEQAPSSEKKGDGNPSSENGGEATPLSEMDGEGAPDSGKDGEGTASSEKEAVEPPSTGNEEEVAPSTGNEEEVAPSTGKEEEDAPSTGKEEEDAPSAEKDGEGVPSAEKDGEGVPSAENDGEPGVKPEEKEMEEDENEAKKESSSESSEGGSSSDDEDEEEKEKPEEEEEEDDNGAENSEGKSEEGGETEGKIDQSVEEETPETAAIGGEKVAAGEKVPGGSETQNDAKESEREGEKAEVETPEVGGKVEKNTTVTVKMEEVPEATAVEENIKEGEDLVGSTDWEEKTRREIRLSEQKPEERAESLAKESNVEQAEGDVESKVLENDKSVEQELFLKERENNQAAAAEVTDRDENEPGKAAAETVKASEQTAVRENGLGKEETDSSNITSIASETPIGGPEHDISLFIKAGSDGESIGNCPFSQRLFMILWLKGVVFNVTTVDLKRYPRLAPKYPESSSAGNDVFAKFSAYIKNTRKDTNESLEKALLKALKKLDDFLNTPLPDEIDAYSTEDLTVSERHFLDGNELTLADCNLLPKLHIIKVVTKKYRNFEFPDELSGLWRYINHAYARDEFTSTCPADREITFAYLDVAKRMK
ncbi:chloride intracellular channel protein 6 isoform X2 [Rhinatrema bivittatum]|uniref:chloride intracellular channel protein 6 isoform X2 n=1 Tax=Rhinatrema bivittatum TaxID=194408 RepID=UPI0011295E28|nr:chloride intracellular channel protein 6 isoform X2 [Rhinatrema bivittatum]